MAAAALPIPPDYQASSGASAEFRNGCVFIASAYSVNGKFYDITYQTDSAKLQKLQSLKPELLIQNLQEQMRAYLAASDAIAAPEKTSFELSAKNDVYALTIGKPKYNITDHTDLATGKTIKAFAQTFHQMIDSSLPEDSNKNPNTPNEKISDSVSEDGAKADQEAEEPDAAPKPPRNPMLDLVRPLKVAGDLNNIGIGTSALLTGSAPSTGWSMYALAIGAGIGLLGNLKQLYDHFINGAPLPEKFIWNFLSNLTLCLAPVLMVFGAFSNPFTAAIVLVVLTTIGLISYIIANWEGIKERLGEMAWWEKILAVVGFALVFGVNAAGVSGASYISMASMIPTIGLEVHSLIKKSKEQQAQMLAAQQEQTT
jgi:hypothetical protein